MQKDYNYVKIHYIFNGITSTGCLALGDDVYDTTFKLNLISRKLIELTNGVTLVNPVIIALEPLQHLPKIYL